MKGRLKWILPALVPVWLISCSHMPGLGSKSAQQPTTPTSPQASSTQGIPQAEIPEKEFNFGLMAEDGNYAHEFRILNRGTGTLEIKEVMAA